MVTVIHCNTAVKYIEGSTVTIEITPENSKVKPWNTCQAIIGETYNDYHSWAISAIGNI